MIARAFGVGIETAPACAEAVPMGVVELGTCSSHWSSWRESVGPWSVYQEPAWLGERTLVILADVVGIRAGDGVGRRFRVAGTDVLFVVGARRGSLSYYLWCPRRLAGWRGAVLQLRSRQARWLRSMHAPIQLHSNMLLVAKFAVQIFYHVL